MGMTNRVVIFADGKDFMWTLSIFVAPVVAFVIGATLVPEGREFSDETPAVVVASIGGVNALIGCVKTLISSISHNGLVLGIIIGSYLCNRAPWENIWKRHRVFGYENDCGRRFRHSVMDDPEIDQW
jgi:hypothetical protein